MYGSRLFKFYVNRMHPIQKSYIHGKYTLNAMVVRSEIVHTRITMEEREKIGERVRLQKYRTESDFIWRAIQEKLKEE